jgi:hypothetical protein
MLRIFTDLIRPDPSHLRESVVPPLPVHDSVKALFEKAKEAPKPRVLP